MFLIFKQIDFDDKAITLNKKVTSNKSKDLHGLKQSEKVKILSTKGLTEVLISKY